MIDVDALPPGGQEFYRALCFEGLDEGAVEQETAGLAKELGCPREDVIPYAGRELLRRVRLRQRNREAAGVSTEEVRGRIEQEVCQGRIAKLAAWLGFIGGCNERV